MTQLVSLAAGVDTLYLSVKGEIDGSAWRVLHSLREKARAEDDPVPFTFEDEDGSLVLRPHGWRGYPVWLSSPRYELMLGASPPFPAGYVQVHSAYIHSLGVDAAADTVTGILRRWLFRDSMSVVVSRIDVYADVQGWEPTHSDYRRFVCRAVTRRQFDAPAEIEREMHSAGVSLSGYTFGRGDVVARIYNKTLELRRRGQDWPLAVWSAFDPERAVWRVEFQYRRKALKALRTVSDVLAARQDLWEYGTDWLSLRTPTRDPVRGHWPIAPEWEAVQAVRIGSPGSGLVRERVSRADETRLLRGLGGYLSSLAAGWYENDLDAALGRAAPRLRHYFTQRGVGFAQLVEVKRSRRPGL